MWCQPVLLNGLTSPEYENAIGRQVRSFAWNFPPGLGCESVIIITKDGISRMSQWHITHYINSGSGATHGLLVSHCVHALNNHVRVIWRVGSLICRDYGFESGSGCELASSRPCGFLASTQVSTHSPKTCNLSYLVTSHCPFRVTECMYVCAHSTTFCLMTYTSTWPSWHNSMFIKNGWMDYWVAYYTYV